MCGIAGSIDLRTPATSIPERVSEVERMIDLIAHRGPDEAGYFVDTHVALGVVRLCIIDIEGSLQPMSDPSGRWWIVYNGEVYNYRELRAELISRGHTFLTCGDTEVVLRAFIEWGEAAAGRLQGGFAFAIYDRCESVAYLGRDRFGKRPLFYRWSGNTLLFGSEMKAFLARPSAGFQWDTQALSDLFGQWTLVDGDTPFVGVRQLRAGTIARVDSRGIRETEYGGFRPAGSGLSLCFADAAAAVRDRLTESVRLRLQSDVEVAVMLSGGLDSTVVTHLAQQASPNRLRTFSIGFEEAEFDESDEQRLVVRHFGVDHRRITVSAEEIADAFADALWHAEIPQFRTAFVPMYLLAKRIARDGVRVVLSGEGADEVFLGYDIFKETRLRAAWKDLPVDQRRTRLGRLYPYLPHFGASNLRALEQVFQRSSHDTDTLLFSHVMRLENGQFAQRMLRNAGRFGRLEAAARAAGLEGIGPVGRAQWLEFHTLLQGYLLSSQGDRMTFAHGVESRSPFLAPDVVDLATSLPEVFHLDHDDREKCLLKAAFRDVLPERILTRPKQPYRALGSRAFFLPDNGPLRSSVARALDPATLSGIESIEPSMATRLIDKVSAGGSISPREDQAFIQLLSLSVLDRQFVSGAERPRPAPRPPMRVKIVADDWAG